MKTNKLLSLALLSIGLYALISCNNTDKKIANQMDSMKMGANDEMDKGMMKGMQGMKDIKMTGVFDCDFATLMINHHQGAILMSEEEIKNGKNPEIRELAQKIITNQNHEIEKMHTIVNNFKTVVAKDSVDVESRLKTQMTEMMKNMHQVKLTGNTDQDFVMMMIPHHESAVKMAQEELKYGKHQELIDMAKQMINDQSKEIDVFKEWLAKQK